MERQSAKEGREAINSITCKPDNRFIVIGPLAERLMGSFDFKITPFAWAVWEVTGDVRLDGSEAAILRANQSTCESAMAYMKDNRVLVHNLTLKYSLSLPTSKA